jgi:hypothetical protein
MFCRRNDPKPRVVSLKYRIGLHDLVRSAYPNTSTPPYVVDVWFFRIHIINVYHPYTPYEVRSTRQPNCLPTRYIPRSACVSIGVYAHRVYAITELVSMLYIIEKGRILFWFHQVLPTGFLILLLGLPFLFEYSPMAAFCSPILSLARETISPDTSRVTDLGF